MLILVLFGLVLLICTSLMVYGMVKDDKDYWVPGFVIDLIVLVVFTIAFAIQGSVYHGNLARVEELEHSIPVLQLQIATMEKTAQDMAARDEKRSIYITDRLFSKKEELTKSIEEHERLVAAIRNTKPMLNVFSRGLDTGKFKFIVEGIAPASVKASYVTKIEMMPEKPAEEKKEEGGKDENH